jgi:putative membrane protein
MTADHNKTTAELKTMVGGGGVNAKLPTAMSSSQQDMLSKLHGLHGKDFDNQYESDQVSGHKDAVSLFQRYSKGGENRHGRDQHCRLYSSIWIWRKI